MWRDHKSDFVAVWQSLRDLDWEDAISMVAIVSFVAIVLTYSAYACSGLR